jgi:hypothetical protein
VSWIVRRELSGARLSLANLTVDAVVVAHVEPTLAHFGVPESRRTGG